MHPSYVLSKTLNCSTCCVEHVRPPIALPHIHERWVLMCSVTMFYGEGGNTFGKGGRFVVCTAHVCVCVPDRVGLQTFAFFCLFVCLYLPQTYSNLFRRFSHTRGTATHPPQRYFVIILKTYAAFFLTCTIVPWLWWGQMLRKSSRKPKKCQSDNVSTPTHLSKEFPCTVGMSALAVSGLCGHMRTFFFPPQCHVSGLSSCFFWWRYLLRKLFFI